MSAKTGVLRTLIACCLLVGSAIAYENAYDLLERRNRKLHEPGHFRSATLFRDRSDIFNPYVSRFGNGYDNLGNGIRSGPFRWRFHARPLRRRTFSDFGFHDHPRYLNDRSSRYELGTRGNDETGRFLEENEDSQQRKSDEVYGRSEEGVSMGSQRREKSGEELRAEQVGENKSRARSNKMVKKGRTTKGFAVHHHKDETGNSTTFFDETSDYGGQSDLRGLYLFKHDQKLNTNFVTLHESPNVSDGFGSKRILEQLVHNGDDKHFKENGGQTKNYSSDLVLGNQRFEKGFSSAGNRQESERKFRTGSEDDGFAPPKTYQYLNGDPFDFAEEEIQGGYY